MSQKPLGAQISHMLKARGVDVIFGIPGVHNVEMYRGIEEAGITHVLARHEQGAGFMADGYARATGRPGVAYVITGPGLCNILTALGQAYSDSVPVLAISSCLDEVAMRRGQLHQMKDQEGAAATVCDWSHTAVTAQAAYGLIDRALAEFSGARPRPKHIQVPIALLGAGAEAAPGAIAPTPRAAIDAQVFGAAFHLIKQAKRPVFIFGGGARAGASAARDVLRHLGAASFTSYAGRGIVGLDDPLHFGARLARGDSARIIASADAVIVVGSELAAVDLWRHELGHGSRMLRVDIDPSVLADQQRADMQVQADAAVFLEALRDELMAGAVVGESGWSAKEVGEARERWMAESEGDHPGIVPIVHALRSALPDDTMIYSDMTQIAYSAKEVWDMARPGHWHHPFGFGTLGYALPAAIGGAMARRGQPTVAIAGDYGFQYTVQELGTAVELGLSLPIILWDNGKLKEIEDCMVKSQIAPNAVIAHNPDFCKLAEAYGALSVEPATLGELQAAVKAALMAPVPTLIRVTPRING